MPPISNGSDATNIERQRCHQYQEGSRFNNQDNKTSTSRWSEFLLFRVGYAKIHSLHSGSHKWDSPWPAYGPGGLARPQGACFPPPGVNQIPFRKDLVATAKSASGYFSGESMVAESSQGTGFLLEGPSARSAANHRKIPRNFRESCQRRWSNRQ